MGYGNILLNRVILCHSPSASHALELFAEKLDHARILEQTTDSADVVMKALLELFFALVEVER